ncbi:MAG: MBL fold metallo-hydrolase [Phycisphaeraceae bacterium]|nr:MBL fold metallo-hydrolase [Phycisphaeraceae bacterium]
MSAPLHAELVLLGTGTSAGVPVIGCDCEVCRSDDPRDRRLRSGALLRFTDPDGVAREVLIDCPPDHREQSLRIGLRRCDGILFTHHHVDHTFGLDEVRRYNALMQEAIEIYADTRTLDHLDRVYRHIFRAAENVNDSFVATLVPRRIEAGRAFTLHGLRVLPIELLHGRVPVLGFRFDGPPIAESAATAPDELLPLAYCTDVNSIPPPAWPALAGVRTLVLDMLRFRAHPTHFTVDQAIATAERIGAERTIFVHMTHDIRHADLDPKLPPGMQLGFDGLRIGHGRGAATAADPLSSSPYPWPT